MSPIQATVNEQESGSSAYFRSSYLKVIKQPMDLKTIQGKLDNGLYSTRHEFVKDVKLIVKNCLLYNGPESHMGTEAIRFDALFTNGQSSFGEFV